MVGIFASRTSGALLSIVTLTAFASGCAKYVPLTVDLATYQEAWQGRDPTSPDVAAFAARLDQMGVVRLESFDPRDGVSLAEAEVIALFFNPDLRTARLNANVPVASAKEAGRWADPALSADVLRVLENVDDPWVLAVGLQFTIPLSGRLGAEQDVARSQARAALARARTAEVGVLLQLGQLWFSWSATHERKRLIESSLDDLDRLLNVAERLRAAGELAETGYRVLRLERTSRQASLQRQQARLRVLTLRIKSLLGLVPRAPIRLEPSLAVRIDGPDRAARLARLRNLNVNLALMKSQHAAAEQRLRREVLKQYPDLTLGPGYESEEGQSRLGISGFGFPIPIWNRNRRGIAEANAARVATQSALGATYERVVGELAAAEAALDAARQQGGFVQQELVPLADQQVAEIRRLAAIGELNILLLSDALTRALDAKQALLNARLAEALAANRIAGLLRRGGSAPQSWRQDHE